MGDISKVFVVHYIEVVSKEDRETTCRTWASSASRMTATATATPYYIMKSDCAECDAVCENNLRKVWR
eukprot:11648604-Heterocapsa_arctica.AAC.1